MKPATSALFGVFVTLVEISYLPDVIHRNAILSLLNGFDDFHINEPNRNLPMDMYLRFHFLKHKKDFNTAARTQIVDYVYTLQRFKGYLNAIASRKSSGEDTITWAARLKAFQTPDFPDLFDHPSIPEHARASMPKELYDTLITSHPNAFQIARTCLERPYLTIRANTLKTSRRDLMKTLKKDYKYHVKECEYAPNGIRFVKQPELSLFVHAEFRKGHFEI